MGSPPRIQIAGGIYHVIARGVDRRRTFVDSDDYAMYIGLVAAVVRRNGWRILSFCLMPNHVHLLVETPEPNLANGMQWLHSRYALLFNERHHRDGHLFSARYRSPLIATDEQFIRTLSYIVMNPVKAVLCKRASDWEWGSHALITSPRPIPRWLHHKRTLELLEAITGGPWYGPLIATRERELLTRAA